MQNWGSEYAKGGSRFQPYGRTSQQRGSSFIDESNPNTRNLSFDPSSSVASESKSSGRGNATAGFNSSNWGNRSIDHGFQKRDSRQHDVSSKVKRGFNDSVDRFQRSEDYSSSNWMQNKIQGLKFDSYQTSSPSFGVTENRELDRNKIYGRKDQIRSYDSLDTYRTAEGRMQRNLPDKEPYESLLNRTKPDIDSYRTAVHGPSGIYSPHSKTERYQTSDDYRSLNKPQDQYSRPDPQNDFFDKGMNRHYNPLMPLDKYDRFRGSRNTLEGGSSKINDPPLDSYNASRNFPDYEKRSQHGGNYNRSSEGFTADDNLMRSALSSRLDYVIGRKTDNSFSASNEIVGSNVPNRNTAFARDVPNQNENAIRMRSRMETDPRMYLDAPRNQGRLQGEMFANSPSKQGMQLETYFTQEPIAPRMFEHDQSLSRKQTGFGGRHQDVRDIAKEGTLFKRQMAREQEREDNRQLLYRKRQEMRDGEHQIPRSTEMVSEQHKGRGIPQYVLNKERLRSQDVESNRMTLELKDEQKVASDLSSHERMMEDRRQQEEMRRLGRLKMQQNAEQRMEIDAHRQIMAKQARALALKNQATIAKQNDQEKTIAVQSSLVKRQHQIAEIMRKRQMMTKSRMQTGSLVRTMGQRLKERARLLETQRRSLESRSRQLRKRSDDKQDNKEAENKESAEKTERKPNASTSSPQKGPSLCDVCNVKVTGPFRIHNQSASHKAKVKQKEASLRNAEMFYCNSCCFKVKGPLEYHTGLKQHQNRVQAIEKGCEDCKITSFSDGKELDKHRASVEHKKNTKKENTSSDESKSSPVKCNICCTDVKSTLAVHQKSAFHKEQEKAVKKGCTLCNITSFSDANELNKHQASSQHTKNVKENKEAQIKKKIDDHLKQFKTEEDIPAYISGKTFGLDFIVPSQGYACHLCQKDRKFYLSEQSAKVDHCKLKSHYDLWKEHELKLIAELEVKSKVEVNSKEKVKEEKKSKTAASKDEKTTKPEDNSEEKQEKEDNSEEKQEKENNSEEKQEKDDHSEEKQEKEDKTKPEESQDQLKMDVDAKVETTDASKPESEKESEKQAPVEEQDMENFKVLDSLESDPEEDVAGSSEKEELAKEGKTQVSPSKARVQKARRGRRVSKT